LLFKSQAVVVRCVSFQTETASLQLQVTLLALLIGIVCLLIAVSRDKLLRRILNCTSSKISVRNWSFLMPLAFLKVLKQKIGADFEA
jgi:ABC-type amino acid transport system permease subunit